MRTEILAFLIIIILPFWGDGQSLRKITTIPIDTAVKEPHLSHARGYNFVGIGRVNQKTRNVVDKKPYQDDGTPLFKYNYSFGYHYKAHPNRAKISITVEDKKLYGFADADGKMVIPCIYDYLDELFFGKNTVGRRDGQYRLIDTLGNETLLPKIKYGSKLQLIGESRMMAKNHRGDVVLYDLEGNALTRGGRFVKFNPHYPDYFLKKSSSRTRHSLYYKGDSLLIRADNETMIQMFPGKIVAQYLDKRSHFQLYDENCQAIKTDKLITDYCGEGFVFAKQYANGRAYGILDENLEVVVPPIYDWIQDWVNQNLKVTKANNRYGVMTYDGEEILPNEYSSHFIMTENDIIASIGKQKYWFDKEGNQLLDESFIEKAKPALGSMVRLVLSKKEHQVLAVQMQDGKYYMFDRKGNLLNDTPFDYLEYLSPNLLIFNTGLDKKGVINEKGEIVLPEVHTHIYPVITEIHEDYHFTGLLVIKEGDSLSIANSKGEILISNYHKPVFEAVSMKHFWISNKDQWEVYEIVNN